MLFLALVVIIVFLLSLCLINRWIHRNSIQLAKQIPSNKWNTFFAFGRVISRKDIIEYLYNHGIKYGPNSIFWMGPIPSYLTSDPETIKNIFTSINCVNKPKIVMNKLINEVGIGPITSNEPVWSRHRKILNKTFSHKNLLSFFPIFNEAVNDLIMEIDANLMRENNVDMLKVFRHFTLKITSKTILKRNLEKTKFDSVTLADYLNEILNYLAAIILNIFWKIDWLRELVKIFKYKDVKKGLNMYTNLITESWNILKNNNNTNDSSYLPEVNSALTYALKGVEENLMKEHEVYSEMLHLFLASFETSATTLYYVLILLAMHPEYQEMANEEIQNILPTNNDDLTLEQVNQLIYLEMVLNETMRVMPIVSTVLRQVSNENVKLSNGVTLTVGQMVLIDIFSLHRSKKVWGPNAELFNPDNFLPSNVANQHPFSFIPFTKGQRFCVGWRYGILLSKISLAKLIRTYKFSTDFKFENLKFENHITTKLLEEPQLYLERRVSN